jgi:hypothetical protein
MVLLKQRHYIQMAIKKDTIGESLGVEIPEEIQQAGTSITKINSVVKAQNNNDYEYARRNMYDILEKGSSALEDMLDLARQSESPRAFEVVTNLIKTLAETNKDLLDLAKAQKDLTKEEGGPEKVVTNNNLFVGSSAELLKMIKKSADESEQ